MCCFKSIRRDNTRKFVVKDNYFVVLRKQNKTIRVCIDIALTTHIVTNNTKPNKHFLHVISIFLVETTYDDNYF